MVSAGAKVTSALELGNAISQLTHMADGGLRSSMAGGGETTSHTVGLPLEPLTDRRVSREEPSMRSRPHQGEVLQKLPNTLRTHLQSLTDPLTPPSRNKGHRESGTQQGSRRTGCGRTPSSTAAHPSSLFT